MTYDDAVTALYQAPVDTFVAERKRLAGELKAAGDKAGATKLGKLGRPTLSAWAVNQLWWHAREAFDALFATAERIRGGELAAQAAHRDAIADLRGRAARILTDAGHNANEATLRRVTTSLSAVAAAGWEPDVPGAIAEDRETVGFDVAMALAHVPVRHAPTRPEPPKPKPEPEPEPEPEIDEEEEAERRASEQRALDAENKKKEHEKEKREHEKREKDERAAKAAERSKLIANLATAQSELVRRKRVVDQLSQQLETAEEQVAEAESIVAGLQSMLEGHA
jgi:outer membrane biosynthesis protein TonB